MSSFNDKLDQCLVKLYEYSSNFKVSIELIQKLAQQLKLETFIDKHAYTVNPNPVYQQLKPQRLSIAGSLILVDIDFTDDSSIINVSLSSANHVNNADEAAEKRSYIKSKSIEDDVNIVNIDFSKNNMSFLRGLAEGENSSAEGILLKNLTTSETLNRFPTNLKYLADLDRLSSASQDLFVYLDQIALLLNTIYSIEENEDWQIKEGLGNSIGKISLNDEDDLQLGLLIAFWKDFRYINHEYEIRNSSKRCLLGKTYKILVKIENNIVNKDSYDYLLDNRENVWKIINSKGKIEKFKFIFDNEIQQSSSTINSIPISKSSSWAIKLQFNYPIALPIYLIEYLGISNYEIDRGESLEFYNKLNNDEVNSSINLSDSEIDARIRQQLTSKFLPISSIELNQLNDLTKLIPSFRNFLVLNNVLQTFTQSSIVSENNNKNNSVAKQRDNNIRNNELDLNSKMKLKESLKLSNDVTDEELLGLNAVSDNNYTANPNQSISLDSFMKNEDEDDNLKEEDFLLVSIDEIDFSSEYYDLIISINGLIKSSKIDIRFKISNGTICETTINDNEMEIDDDKNKKFIKGLNLTEDLIKILKFVYLE